MEDFEKHIRMKKDIDQLSKIPAIEAKVDDLRCDITRIEGGLSTLTSGVFSRLEEIRKEFREDIKSLAGKIQTLETLRNRHEIVEKTCIDSKIWIEEHEKWTKSFLESQSKSIFNITLSIFISYIGLIITLILKYFVG